MRLVLGCALALFAGCHHAEDLSTFDASVGDLAAVATNDIGDGTFTPTVTASGHLVDTGRLVGYLAQHPDATTADVLGACAVPNAPIRAYYDGGAGVSDGVLTDAEGAFALQVVAGKPFHLVPLEDLSAHRLSTFDAATYTATDSEPLTDVVAYSLGTNPSDLPVGLAAALGSGTTAEDITTHGACFLVTLSEAPSLTHFSMVGSTISSVTPAVDVWAATDPTTTPPTFTKQTNAASGIFAVYDAQLTTAELLSIVTTPMTDMGTTTSACPVNPGFVTLSFVTGT